ncbi:MAG: undecaprenyl-diphosphate phosphatase [Proteobacteria bacterium]|jgi:undecaprenyl-diphosphatase|nr:undecaprenyl-diphosphate phosphatase [Pseudomonadota bacterium]
MIFISAIEGLTEFLPVSSTAHILILSHMLDIKLGMEYIVAVQLGAILSVFALYPNRIRQIFLELCHFKGGLWVRVLIITMPTLIIGFIFHIMNMLSVFSLHIMQINLIIGGIIMLIFRKSSGKVSDIHSISKKAAFIIGLFQIVSLIPGVSRSASVIFGGLFTGLSRKLAIEISFISGIPVIFGASVLEIYSSYSQGVALQSPATLVLNMAISSAFACMGILLLKWFASVNKDFEIFGIYRIMMGVLLFAII